MVEDHPFDYRNFEGIIPEGNYGAGTVIVWDEGYYEPLEESGKPKKEQEKILLQQLKKGDIKLNLKGKKIKGAFALVKIKSDEDNAWLLIKKKDDYATDDDITKKDKSVLSKKTLDEVEKSSKKVWESNRKSSGKKASSKGKSTTNKTVAASKKKVPEIANDNARAILENISESAFPELFKPMLASTTEKPFTNADWLFEIKWDGYRMLSFIQNKEAQLISRNLLPYNAIFPEVLEALQELDFNCVLDGEVVAVNDKGLPDFQKLQNVRNNVEAARLVYHVFDLLWYDGKNIMELSFTAPQIYSSNNTSTRPRHNKIQ